MFGRILGAVIGSRLDRRDGKGGFKGAVMGAMGAGMMRRVLPLGLLVGGGIAAKRAMDRRKARAVVE